jgi:signal transduction histidine kinase
VLTLSLTRTSSFRFALLYAAVFSASVVALLAFIYWSTVAVLDQQIDATIEAELRGLSEQYRAEGLPGLVEVIRARAGEPGNTDRVYLLADPALRPLGGNLAAWPAAATGPSGQWIELRLAKLDAGDGEPHLIRARSFVLPDSFNLLVGRDTQERGQFRATMIETLGWSLAATLALALSGGVLLSRRLLRRVDAVSVATGRIMQGDWGRRLPVSAGGDEFDRLSGELNAMLDQIERLMTGMRAVTDSIAHDLRSPLTRLQGRIEQALREALPAEERRRLLEAALADLDGVLHTFKTLIEIARAEAGSGRAAMETVDLGALAEAVADLYRPVAEDKLIAFTAAIAPGLAAHGHGPLLAQALSNLVDNAVKYTPSGGTIALIVQASPTGAEFIVADSGPGIPESERAHVLERFVRLDSSADTPGSGLGLSLVAAVAKLHRGRLTLADNAPGLRATLSLPQARDRSGLA